jgi:hypothetical protein
VSWGLFGVATGATAGVLTFDDITTDPQAPIPDGYGGLIWQNLVALNAATADNSGVSNGRVSGDYVASSDGNSAVTIDSGTFDFGGAYFTASYNDGLQIEIDGYLDGNLLYSQTITVNTSGPTQFQADYAGVDTVVFTSSGGVPHGFESGSGEGFVLDNFALGQPTGSVVPEPTTVSLLGLGAVGMAGYRLRIRRRTEADAV